MADKKTPLIVIEKGTRGRLNVIDRSGAVYQNEFLQVLKGTNAIKVFREMRDNDSTVNAVLLAYENILTSSKWELIGGSSQARKLIIENFESLPWLEVLSNILTMLAYGWTVLEIIYDIMPNGKLGWKSLDYRPQETLDKWIYEPSTNAVKSMVQSVDGSRLEIPLNKCLHFKAGYAGNSPEGRSILRGCYRQWFFKKTLEEIEAIGIERDLVGIPVITPAPDIDLEDDAFATEKAYVEKLVATLRQDALAGVIKPTSEWGVELLSSPGKRQFDMDVVIHRYDKRIALSMLAQFILLGLERIGSYGLAKSQTELFYDGLEGWALKIADVFNRQAIFALVSLYFPKTTFSDCPKLKPSRIRKIDFNGFSSLISAFAKAGLIDVNDAELKAQVKDIVSNELR